MPQDPNYPTGMLETPPGLFPKRPIELTGLSRGTSITPEIRATAGKWLDQVLGKGDPPTKQPIIPYYSMNPQPNVDLASQLLLRANPNVFANVHDIDNMKGEDPDINGMWHPPSGSLLLNPRLSNATNIEKLMDTYRHELSHSKGMEDEGSPNAYEVGQASDLLHKDIRLPHERHKK